MERIVLKDVGKYLDKKVTVQGWVSRIRNLGSITFVILRDRSGILQLVIENLGNVNVRPEDVVEVSGKAVASTNAPGEVEIYVQDYKVIAKATYEVLPFSVNRDKISAGLDLILDNRALSLRNMQNGAIFKVQHHIATAFREFFTAHDFTEIHTPKLVASGTEGGTELFEVDYFGKKAYLAQSPQLYKQMMVGAGFERVYEIGHVYRAEPHETSRHINEYVSMDIEMGFIESEQDLITLETAFIRYLSKHLHTHCSQELAMHHAELAEVTSIPQFTLYEVQEILRNSYNKQSPSGNIDAEGERMISQYVKQETDCDFVFITGYPTAKRPFYTMPDSCNSELTKSFDLLYKGLEITSGGQRIHDYHQLCANIQKHGMRPETFQSYLDVFKYGMPPHGGFAIGLERLTMKLLDLKNIREATLLPRDRSRITP
jgi:nondiscriminating aspartyl-tRNA synthetase